MTVTISYEQQQFIMMDISWPSLLVHIYGDVHWPSPKAALQKYRCCGDIQGPSRIMTIMMDNDHHHFISTTMIYGYGPLRVVTIDAYIWWRSLTITISYFGDGWKMSPKLIGDGQKLIPYGSCQGMMESNHQTPACKVGALPLS